MKIRKILTTICAALLAVCMCAACVGCGSDSGNGGAAANVPENAGTSAEMPEKVEHLSANGITTWDTGYIRTDIDSLEIVRLMGNGINLGNAMEACDNNVGNVSDETSYYETLWGQPITTQEIISGFKAAGFDSIRIPVAWMTNATHLNEGDYTISTDYLDRVEEIINYALNEDMYVIVNDHWDGGWLGMFGSESEETREFAMEAYIGMWTQIANRYKEYSDYLIFEGANEEIGTRLDENSPLYCSDSITSYMTMDEYYELGNKINQTFVDTVRATGGNNAMRFLLIPGFNTNIDQTCDDRYVMPTDEANRLIISVHCYDPWSYCGATSSASATAWGTKENFEEIGATLAKMTKFTDQGYGVIIGEYGVLPGADGSLKTNTLDYHTNFLLNCDAYGYCPVLWDCSGFFVRKDLKMSDDGIADLYKNSSFAAQEGTTPEDLKTIALRKIAKLIDAAPESFREDTIAVDASTAVAWIMWNSGDWSISYSVGDEYNPNSISPGLVPTDVIIEGEGTYTVALDFTGTSAGFSTGTAFSALAIMNGEVLYPGYYVVIKEIKINGTPYTLKGEPYTCSDNGITTRVNLYNEWITVAVKDIEGARVYGGDASNATPCIIDKADIGNVETIEITFDYIAG